MSTSPSPGPGSSAPTDEGEPAEARARAEGAPAEEAGAGEPLLSPAQHAELEALLGARVEVLARIGSTNEELIERTERAARRGEPLADLSLLATEHQSSGRGRLSRTWITGPGEALTFSVLLRPGRGTGALRAPLPTQHFPWLTVLLAASVVQVLRGAGIPAQIKWPNDVLVPDGTVRGRKICGVLGSLVSAGDQAPCLVLGAGLNVAARPQPASTATSVRAEGAVLSRGELLVAIMRVFTGVHREFLAQPAALTDDDGALRARILPLLGTIGSRVRAELPGRRPALEGVAVGLDTRGALIIDGPEGRTAVTAGDVVHLRPAASGADAEGGRA